MLSDGAADASVAKTPAQFWCCSQSKRSARTEGRPYEAESSVRETSFTARSLHRLHCFQEKKRRPLQFISPLRRFFYLIGSWAPFFNRRECEACLKKNSNICRDCTMLLDNSICQPLQLVNTIFLFRGRAEEGEKEADSRYARKRIELLRLSFEAPLSNIHLRARPSGQQNPTHTWGGEER